jgi:hypothetical protein
MFTGPEFACKDVSAHGGNQKKRRQTMASKKPTQKLKKGSKLTARKTLFQPIDGHR